MNPVHHQPASSGLLRGRSAFTLTATAVAAALFTLVLFFTFRLVVTGQRRTATGTVEADLQQQALLLVYRLTQEVSEAREILLPLRPDHVYPFLAFRTVDHEIVMYTFQKKASRILRQIIDPSTWSATESRVVCADVDDAGFSSGDRQRLVRLDLTLGRQLGDKRETLPLATGIGVRGW